MGSVFIKKKLAYCQHWQYSPPPGSYENISICGISDLLRCSMRQCRCRRARIAMGSWEVEPKRAKAAPGLLRSSQASACHWLRPPPAPCHPPGPRAALAASAWEGGEPSGPRLGDQGDLATARPGARGSNFSMRSGSLGEGGHRGS